jgi:hypothetical protein
VAFPFPSGREILDAVPERRVAMQERKLTRGKLLAAGGAAAGIALTSGPAALADPKDDDLTGSWHNVITLVNPPLGTIDSLITFGQDGTVVESRRLYIPFTPLGAFLGTTGHGGWKRQHGGTFAVAYQIVMQQAPPSTGDIVGIDNVSLGLTLDKHTDTISGSFGSILKSPTGTVLFTIQGTLTGTRITP